MIRFVVTVALALLSLAGGVVFKVKKKKLPGIMFIVTGIELCLCVTAIVMLDGVFENIAALFLYVITAITALIFAIKIKIKFKVRFPKTVKKILLIVPATAVILAGAGYGVRFMPIYSGIAENIKPVTGKDGISHSLYFNCFYKDRIPGYTYSEAIDIEYYSEVTGKLRPAKVVLPENYDENKKYPVLYLLHGLGGSEVTWLHKNADVIIKNMHYLYNCPEMVVVMPNSNVNENNSTSGMSYAKTCEAFDRTEEDLIGSLMPYVNEHFSVCTDKKHTAIAGNSMGARNSMAIAFHNQDKFDYVGVFSAADVIKGDNNYFPPLLDELKIDDRAGGFGTLMVMVGREDYICGDVSYDLDKKLDEAGIEHVFYDVFGVHHNPVWQNGLYNFMIKIRDNMD